MSASRSKMDYIAEYNKKYYKQIQFRLQVLADRDILMALDCVKDCGESVNQYIKDAIRLKMDKEMKENE